MCISGIHSCWISSQPCNLKRKWILQKFCSLFSDNSVSVKNLLRRIQDLENKMLAMEAKMVLFVKRYTGTSIFRRDQERWYTFPQRSRSIPAVPMPSPPPGLTPGHEHFFYLKVGKFPRVGTHELSKCPGVGTKKEGKLRPCDRHPPTPVHRFLLISE